MSHTVIEGGNRMGVISVEAEIYRPEGFGEDKVFRKFPLGIVHYNGIPVKDLDSMVRCAMRWYASGDIHSGIYSSLNHLVKLTPLG